MEGSTATTAISWFLLCLIYAAVVPAAIVPHVKDSPAALFGHATTAAANKSSTLELVHVLFRHGPRTPVNTYPKDPYINETYEPYGWGQLTNNAKVELYKIGKQLRKRYKDFLPSYYRPEILHAQATESSRTMMSLQMVLAGLFPPQNTPMEWNLLLNWQPIPIFADAESKDLLLRQKVPCPRYDEAVVEVMNLAEVKQLHREYAELLQNLTEITGLNVSYAHDVTNVYISLTAEEAYGLKLPAWTEDYYPDKLLQMASKAYIYDAYTTELRKLKGGYFLQSMYAEMQSKIAGKLKPKERRLFIYCAHDWTVSNILSALGAWPGPAPRFSALVAIELRRRTDNGEYFVEIYFQNDPNKEPELLHVPDCGKQCPLKKLLELSKPVLPDDSYEKLCKPKGTEWNGQVITYH